VTTELGRGPDLTLARMHLRLGSYALARAELEAMAGQEALDDDGLDDLVEARWRTGDLVGAGEAAALVLERGRSPVLALVVAAEAAAARGRPSEARRLAARALEAAGGSIDETFAGMPRAAIWPADPAAPPPAPTTLFQAVEPGTSGAAAGPIGAGATGGAAAAGGPGTEPADGAEAGTGSLRLWDMPGEPLPGEAGLPTAELEFASGREALEVGDVQRAATHLGLVLRLAPSMAPTVLDLVADRSEPPLALVRGDAYRLVGREFEARQAFADAAREPDPFGWIGGARVPAEDAGDGVGDDTRPPATDGPDEPGGPDEADEPAGAAGPEPYDPPSTDGAPGSHPEGDPA
jgi:hypothetical protein